MPPIIYHPGEPVKTSGLYRVVHYTAHPNPTQSTQEMERFVAGEIFPRCRICADHVDYLLIKGAPPIFDDPDFASMR